MRAANAFALASALLGAAGGCAHRPADVTRLVDDRLVVGEYIGPARWESAYADAASERSSPTTVLALDAALARGDREEAARLARLLVDVTDARVEERVARALIDAGELEALERFVARHVGEPAFAIAFESRLDRETELVADAIARGFASSNRLAPRVALAMVHAGRLEDARSAIAIASPSSPDDYLHLAESSLGVDDPARALELALAAYDHGASARALEIAAIASSRLGREAEAAALRARADAALVGTIR